MSIGHETFGPERRLGSKWRRKSENVGKGLRWSVGWGLFLDKGLEASLGVSDEAWSGNVDTCLGRTVCRISGWDVCQLNVGKGLAWDVDHVFGGGMSLGLLQGVSASVRASVGPPVEFSIESLLRKRWQVFRLMLSWVSERGTDQKIMTRVSVRPSIGFHV